MWIPAPCFWNFYMGFWYFYIILINPLNASVALLTGCYMRATLAFNGLLYHTVETIIFFTRKFYLQFYINHFMSLVSLYTPLKTSETWRFSNVVRGYRKRPAAWNELKSNIFFQNIVRKTLHEKFFWKQADLSSFHVWVPGAAHFMNFFKNHSEKVYI